MIARGHHIGEYDGLYGVNHQEKIQYEGIDFMKVEVEFRVIKTGTVVVDVPDNYSESELEAEAENTYTEGDFINASWFEVTSYTELE